MTTVEQEVSYLSRSGASFVIRPCADMDEVARCVALQGDVWGYEEADLVPPGVFVLAQALGGHLLSAWTPEGELAAYAMAIAAHEPGPGAGRGRWMQPVAAGVSAMPAAAAPAPYLHSHQVAVAAPFRSEGLGFAMKLAQRQEALRAGLRIMRWTFDPTMPMNAYFNLQRLGAIVRLYVPDFYGPVRSRLQGGLPSDRLLAEWDLRSDRVARAAGRLPRSEPDPALRIALPGELKRAKAAMDIETAVALQAVLRAELSGALAGGLVLCGFQPEGDGGSYLLRPSEDFPRS